MSGVLTIHDVKALAHLSDYGWPKRASVSVRHALLDLAAVFEAFEPKALRSGGEFWSVWVLVPRGMPDDWRPYESWAWDRWDIDHDEDAVDGLDPCAVYSRDEWLLEWQEWFPRSAEWIPVDLVRDGEWLSLAVDGRTCLSAGPDAEFDPWDMRLVDLVSGLSVLVARTVSMAQDGFYPSCLDAYLPVSSREGIVLRADAAAADPAFDIGRDLPGDLRARMVSDLRLAASHGLQGRRPSTLTPREYYLCLRDAYRACGLDGPEPGSWACRKYPPGDPRSWYSRYGDARDDEFLSLPMDDPESFLQDHRGNHSFEVFSGHGFSNVHAFPTHSEDGWSIYLRGSVPSHGVDMYWLWKTFVDAGYPVEFGQASALADALELKDWILLVPRWDLPVYKDGVHGGKEVVQAANLSIWLCDPDSQAAGEEIASKAVWFPVEASPLA